MSSALAAIEARLAVSWSTRICAVRTLSARTRCAALTPGAVDRAWATAAANTAAISRAAPACQRICDFRPAAGRVRRRCAAAA